MKKKSLPIVFLVAIIGALTLVGSMSFNVAEASTTVSSTIITSDTTWTKANSPYTLTGPVAVNSGVTLKIEAGATVNFGQFYIQVNGTLTAQGTATEKVILNDSNDYPADRIKLQHAGANCTIQNAILNKTSIFSDIGTLVKLDNCTFDGEAGISVYGSSTVSNTYVTGGVLVRGPSVISNNTIIGGIDAAGLWTISGNNISNNQGIWVVNVNGKGNITNNVISGGTTAGINLVGATSIERNLITNTKYGISVRSNVNVTIQNNTITNNEIGILSPSTMQTIIFNNIQNNSNYNIFASQLGTNATYNWWGTANQTAIRDSFYDFHSDFNLGNVTFLPFLNAPNPAAMPDQNVIQPPVIPEEFPSWIILAMLVVSTLVGTLVLRRKRQ